MKKIFIVFIAAICLCSCVNPRARRAKERRTTEVIQNSHTPDDSRSLLVDGNVVAYRCHNILDDKFVTEYYVVEKVGSESADSIKVEDTAYDSICGMIAEYYTAQIEGRVVMRYITLAHCRECGDWYIKTVEK